jgi:anti-sigma regulatory factor (Ser/Thr protein kinase)
MQMDSLSRTFRIQKRDFTNAGNAAISVKKILKSLSLSACVIRKVSICGYEGEMNVVMHAATDGILEFEITEKKIYLTVSDEGPGIEDIETAMQKGYSTASDEFREMGFGAGMGLYNIRENADSMNIDSTIGAGTVIRMEFNTGG